MCKEIMHNPDVPIETVLRCCIRDLKKAYQEIGMLNSYIGELEEELQKRDKRIDSLIKANNDYIKRNKEMTHDCKLEMLTDKRIEKKQKEINSLKEKVAMLYDSIGRLSLEIIKLKNK